MNLTAGIQAGGSGVLIPTFHWPKYPNKSFSLVNYTSILPHGFRDSESPGSTREKIYWDRRYEHGSTTDGQESRLFLYEQHPKNHNQCQALP